MKESLKSLKEKLTHYYEVDLDNCKMTHDDWIGDLANAILDPEYYNRFIKEYNKYRGDRYTECDVCDGDHFIVSNDEDGNEEVQKCDECNIFETDEDAKKHFNEFH